MTDPTVETVAAILIGRGDLPERLDAECRDWLVAFEQVSEVGLEP